jgi:hypothetical protein
MCCTMLVELKIKRHVSYPRTGPHCPKVASIANPPARLESVAWVFPTHTSNCATEVKINTARKRPKYLGATPVVVPNII